MYPTRWNHSDINRNISFIINQTLFHSEKRWMLPLAEKRESQKGGRGVLICDIGKTRISRTGFTDTKSS